MKTARTRQTPRGAPVPVRRREPVPTARRDSRKVPGSRNSRGHERRHSLKGEGRGVFSTLAVLAPGKF